MIGLGSSFSRSVTANAAADPMRRARTRSVGTYRAKAPAILCALWYDFTL